MKITKLGLDWGAAYEEATPIRITHGDSVIEVYASENHRLVVQAVGARVTAFNHDGRYGLEMIV